MSYFYSENGKKDSIEIKKVGIAMDSDYPPHYYIKITTTYGVRIEWDYTSKELRDKELKELRKLRDEIK